MDAHRGKIAGITMVAVARHEKRFPS
jgi:hypothetical protein